MRKLAGRVALCCAKQARSSFRISRSTWWESWLQQPSLITQSNRRVQHLYRFWVQGVRRLIVTGYRLWGFVRCIQQGVLNCGLQSAWGFGRTSNQHHLSEFQGNVCQLVRHEVTLDTPCSESLLQALWYPLRHKRCHRSLDHHNDEIHQTIL